MTHTGDCQKPDKLQSHVHYDGNLLRGSFLPCFRTLQEELPSKGLVQSTSPGASGAVTPWLLTRAPQNRQGPEPSCSQTMRPHSRQLLMSLCFWPRHSQAWRPGMSTASLSCPSLVYRLTYLGFFLEEMLLLPTPLLLSWAWEGKNKQTVLPVQHWQQRASADPWAGREVQTSVLLPHWNETWTRPQTERKDKLRPARKAPRNPNKARTSGCTQSLPSMPAGAAGIWAASAAVRAPHLQESLTPV